MQVTPPTIKPFVITTLTIIFSLPCFTVSAQSPRRMTQADVDRLFEEVSNWGRWGKEDQLGALNLITAEKRKQAATLVKQGISVSLARNAEEMEAADNPSPFEQTMLKTGSEPKSVALTVAMCCPRRSAKRGICTGPARYSDLRFRWIWPDGWMESLGVSSIGGSLSNGNV